MKQTLDNLKKKQDEEFEKIVKDNPNCSAREARDLTLKFFDQVRSETAEVVAMEEREKLRVKICDYLKKICWTEKDIEYFMRANQLNK